MRAGSKRHVIVGEGPAHPADGHTAIRVRVAQRSERRAPAQRSRPGVIVTSGPIIEASVSGAGPGETARGVGKTAHLSTKPFAFTNPIWVEP